MTPPPFRLTPIQQRCLEILERMRPEQVRLVRTTTGAVIVQRGEAARRP